MNPDEREPEHQPEDENVFGDENINPQEEDTVLLGKQGVIEAIKNEDNLATMIEKIKRANYESYIVEEIEKIRDLPVRAFKERFDEVEKMMEKNDFIEYINTLDGGLGQLGDTLKGKLLKFLEEKSNKE